MCVFLCPKGGGILNNQRFMFISNDDKQQKLGTVIRSRTHDALTCEQVRHLLTETEAGHQYRIEVFTEPMEFCNALVLDPTYLSCDEGKIVFGQALFGFCGSGHLLQEDEPAAAIIIRCYEDQPDYEARSILIYVPQNLNRKGTESNDKQGFQKKACV